MHHSDIPTSLNFVELFLIECRKRDEFVLTKIVSIGSPRRGQDRWEKPIRQPQSTFDGTPSCADVPDVLKIDPTTVLTGVKLMCLQFGPQNDLATVKLGSTRVTTKIVPVLDAPYPDRSFWPSSLADFAQPLQSWPRNTRCPHACKLLRVSGGEDSVHTGPMKAPCASMWSTPQWHPRNLRAAGPQRVPWRRSGCWSRSCATAGLLTGKRYACWPVRR